MLLEDISKKQGRDFLSIMAFTLLELIIIIVIISIIACIAVIGYGNVLESGRKAEAYAVLAEIVTAEKRYYFDNNNTYATIGDWAQLDSFSSDPSDTSDNFTFSVPSTDASSGYAQAARTSSSGGRLSYGMCLQSGKRAACDDGVCDPSCP